MFLRSVSYLLVLCFVARQIQAMSSSEYQFILYSFLVDFVGIVCAFNFGQKWDQTGSILDPKKGVPGNFFRLSAQRRPAEPTDPTRPSPKHPKDPQRHPREPFLEHFGSKKAAQMRPRRCTGDTWSQFLAKIVREWAAEVIFEAIWIFFCFSKYFYGTFC